MKTFARSLLLFVLLFGVTGWLYPLACTAVAKVCFGWTSGGSILRRGGAPVGSALLAQPTDDPRYFWPRPSACDYATVPSGASQAGPTSGALREAVEARRARFGADAPAEMLACSGSGLDPHISAANARWQAGRVSAARGLSAADLDRLVGRHVLPPQWGILGETRVNVLALNLALDEAD